MLLVPTNVTIKLIDMDGKFKKNFNVMHFLASNLKGHTDTICSIFAPEDSYFMTWGRDHSIRIWNEAGILKSINCSLPIMYCQLLDGVIWLSGPNYIIFTVTSTVDDFQLQVMYNWKKDALLLQLDENVHFMARDGEKLYVGCDNSLRVVTEDGTLFWRFIEL